MIVTFDSCFDGTRFGGPGEIELAADGADVSVGFVMPGLIDSAGGVFGYEEGFPETGALDPLLACLREYAAGGVVSVMDAVQPLPTVRSLRRLAGPAVEVQAAGGALDGPSVSRPTARVVLDGDDVRAEVEAAAADGARFVLAGRHLPSDLMDDCADAAREHDLVLAISWGTEPRPVVPGALYVGLAPLAHGLAGWEQLREIDTSDLVQWAAEAGAAGATIVPLAALFVRRLLLGEAVSDPGASRCTDFLPYTEQLARMRGPVGLAVGRKRMLERGWVGSGAGADADLAARLADTLAEASDACVAAGGELALGSGFPEFGVFPSTGLYAEATVLNGRGLPWEQLLAAATRGARLDDPGVRLVACDDAVREPCWPTGLRPLTTAPSLQGATR